MNTARPMLDTYREVITPEGVPLQLPAAGPVLVMHTPRLEVERAQASAMLPAPASPRAITKRTLPRANIASRIGMLWIQITPNAAFTPQCSRNWATAAPTVICAVLGMA